MKSNVLIRNKVYLYITEFFSGMSVMAVELGASRLLAPYFSSSQIVWTIIIGTIMIAMALGNIYGGKSADKTPEPDKLYMRLIIASLWICAIPSIGKYLILVISASLVFTVKYNLLIWSSFLTCMIIFVYPLFLLGTVTPSLVKYSVDNLDDNGKTVGTLGAFNTIGSILGTFLPTFVTIPQVGTSITFLIFSGILLILGLIYFFTIRTHTIKCIISIVLFIIFTISGAKSSFAFWEKNLLYEGESIYNYLQVKENDDNVILSTNVLFGVQSIMKKNNSLTEMYYDYALAAPLMNNASEKDILILGMGTGTFAKQCALYFENVNIEGIEIDQKITDLSRKFFSLPESIIVTNYDGRAYLNATDKKYDIIMVDAYQDITIPFQMSSLEFFNLVNEHLKENGIMVVNMNMTTKKEGNINQYLCDTISSVFSNVYTVDVRNTTNCELFASQNSDVLEILKQNTGNIQDKRLKSFMKNISYNINPYTKGTYILTDDKAPVELLGMKVIDEIIQNEVEYYKGILKEEGINGLLNKM